MSGGGAPRAALLGDSALLFTLSGRIDPGANARVHALAAGVAALGLPGVKALVPSYGALAVHFDPLAWDPEDLERALAGAWDRAAAPPAPRTVEIPVRYGGEDGPDLEEVARHCGLEPGEVVRRHAGGAYRVHFLGFAPGFPYLGGLDPTLATPRRDAPRTRVPAGSVGIAGGQTGIYPLESPGGWRLIGRTPLVLFDPGRMEPCLLRPGDLLRFVEAP